ncbi:hypothetical protein L1049_002478 [Liquidambar formosana]|uniref:Uncharacterized protein n=1 Tax=Liquidambar formosana TaxID=63359 RepID=A0AAP0NJR6_LIQFO
MALKAILFLLASFLLLTTRVTSDQAEIVEENAYVPPQAPVIAPPANSPMAPPPMHPHGCTPLCEERCKMHRKKRPCMKVCTTCCRKCNCVPPGPSGNEDKCNKWDEVTIHGQMYKCP